MGCAARNDGVGKRGALVGMTGWASARRETRYGEPTAATSGAREVRNSGRLSAGEAGLECVDRVDARREAGLFDQHDGESVPDGVGQAADLGDEEVALGAQPAAGERAAEQVEELRVDGAGGSLGGHRLGRS